MSILDDMQNESANKATWRYDYAKRAFFDKQSGERLPFTFDPDEEIFTTSTGVALKIDRISTYTLSQFKNQYESENMPPIPVTQRDIGDGKYIEESDVDNKSWQLEYSQYLERANLAMLEFLIVFSVEIVGGFEIDSKTKKMLRRLGVSEDDPDYEDKALYQIVNKAVSSDEQETLAFFAVLKGRSMLTKLSLEESGKRFPDEDSGA